MSLIDCLRGHVKEGVFTEDELKDINRRFNQTYQNFKGHMSDHDAINKASVDFMKNEIKRLEKEKFNDLRSVIVQNQIWKSIERRVAQSGSKRPEYVKQRLAYEEILDKAHGRKNTVKREYFRILDEVFEKFKTDPYTGLFRENPLEEFQDMVRVALGEKPLDPKNLAGGQALRAAFEYSGKRYEAAGGIINLLENFFPQTVHLSKKVGKVKFSEWRNDIYETFESTGNINPLTGVPMSPEEFDKLLPRIYNNIVDNGRTAATLAAEKNLPQELKDVDLNRAFSRFFRAKGADALFKYNNKYGHGPDGLFDVFLNYFDRMARDTANLEILGPRPKALHQNIMRRLEAYSGRKALGGRNWVNGQFQVLVGTYDGAPDEPLLQAVGNLQNILRAAYLGGAGVAAVGDATFLAATARLKGLPITEAISNYRKLLNPLNKEHKQLARDAGYILEMASGRNIVDHKFTADNMGGKMTAGMANAVIKLSGLEHVTKAARDAISLTMESNTARMVKNNVEWDSIAPEMRDMFLSHGIRKKEWDIIRQVQPLENPDNGVAFIGSRQIEQAQIGTEILPARLDPRRAQFQDDIPRYTAEIEELNQKLDEIPTMKDLTEMAETESTQRQIRQRVSLEEKRNKLIADRKQTQETLDNLPPDIPEREVPIATPQKLREIASNYDDLIENLRDLTSNEASLKTKALSTGAAFGDAGPNSILRAFTSSAFMFKTFPIQVMFNHLIPATANVINQKGRGGYEHLMTTVVGSMFMGAAILQLKSIAQGKETADMDSWKFWKAAMMQGGGLGLIGDMTLNEHRYGSGPFLSTLKGPVVGTLDDGWEVFEKNFQRMMEEGKETKFFADSFRFLRKRTPGQNLIWTKMITDRFILDEIEKMADPDFNSRVNRIRTKNIREMNQDFFFPPGGTTGEALRNIGFDISAADVGGKVDASKEGSAENPLTLPDLRHYAADDAAKETLTEGKRGRVATVVADAGDKEAMKALIRGRNEIDFKKIVKLEGGERLDAYVPKKNGKAIQKSGVTVSAGVDLGQMSEARMKKLKFSKDLKEAISPYLGKKGKEAIDFLKENPLKLTEKQSEELFNKIKADTTNRLITAFNKLGGKRFNSLSSEWQTVLASTAYQFGVGGIPRFMGLLSRGDFEGAKEELRNFTPQRTFRTRRAQELKLVEDAEKARKRTELA